jgi:hypothetical protein
MSTNKWGQVKYKKHVLSGAAWDSEKEKHVYDEVFYKNDVDDLRVATPFVRRFMLKELDHWDSCCDLGCGLGLWVGSLIGDKKDVIGVDFSDGAKEMNILGERYIHSDLTKPINIGRTFDVVTCWEVFEHLPSELHVPLLDNVVALKPKVLIMSCAGMKVTGRDTGELDPPLEKQKGRHHYSCMPLREFAEIVNKSGFQVDGLLTALWRQVPKLPSHYRNNTLIFTST